ncbi:MAG: serine hydrolase domain-containing protein [Polyangiaceae bacterium]|jgi:CubicO group peptidase (beta-lactamase class C family)
MQIRRRSFLGVTASALAGCTALGRRAGDARVEEERVQRHVPGAAVARVRRGAPDAIDAHGDLGAETLVEVASLSKPVFAFAVVSEAARGAIDLDAPLARLSPAPYSHIRRGAVDAFDDPRLAQVTPRLLLSHRSGLPNWSRTEPLAFADAPGTGWRYSSEGYVLLSGAVEAATREHLDALARRRVFGPLAMRHSTFDPSAAGARAEGHDRSGGLVPSSLDGPVSATSLLTTVADYARFARRLVEAPQGDAVVDTMLASQVDVDKDRRITWGVGLALAEPGWFFHWGANPGFRSLVVGSRSRGEAVVVVTNSEAGMEVAADAVRSRFGELPLLTFPMLYPPD